METPVDQPEQVSTYGNIADVSVTTWSYFFTPLNILIVAVSTILIFLGGGYMLLTYLVLGVPDFQAIFFPFLGIALLLLRYGYLKEKVLGDFLRQIAQEGGYVYFESASADTVSGLSFERGHGETLTHVLSKMYKSYPTRIFDFTYTMGAGKDSRDYDIAVYELDCGKKLPRALLNPFYSFTPSTLEPVRLEGNFSDVFRLDVQKGLQVEIRELFTPDVMEQFILHFKGFKLEIYGTKVYIMRDGSLTTNREKFFELQKVAEDIFSVLLRGLLEIGK